MLWTLGHHAEHSLDVLERDTFVKEVGHAVHKYKSPSPPPARHVEGVRNKLQIEAPLKRVSRHASEALCKGLGVAKLAAGRDLCAAAHRVPSSVCPFNRTFLAHSVARG